MNKFKPNAEQTLILSLALGFQAEQTAAKTLKQIGPSLPKINTNGYLRAICITASRN